MKRNLEEELAKHLDGCFFWEATTKHDDYNTGPSAEIRRLQRSFRPKQKPKPLPTKVEMPKVENFDSSPKSIQKLIDLVCRFFDVKREDVLGSSRVKEVALARRFLLWAACRYCPKASLAKIGEVIGRHHSTVIHSRDLLNKEIDKYETLIKSFDSLMDYKPV